MIRLASGTKFQSSDSKSNAFSIILQSTLLKFTFYVIYILLYLPATIELVLSSRGGNHVLSKDFVASGNNYNINIVIDND